MVMAAIYLSRDVEDHRDGGARATHRQVGVTFGVDYTVITRAWARFQQHFAPVRRHGVG